MNDEDENGSDKEKTLKNLDLTNYTMNNEFTSLTPLALSNIDNKKKKEKNVKGKGKIKKNRKKKTSDSKVDVITVSNEMIEKKKKKNKKSSKNKKLEIESNLDELNTGKPIIENKQIIIPSNTPTKILEVNPVSVHLSIKKKEKTNNLKKVRKIKILLKKKIKITLI